MSSNSTFVCTQSLAKRSITFLLALLCAASIARAQDAIRPSLAGETSAAARSQSLDRIPYNLMVGPVRFRFSATAGVEWNDNINLSEKDTKEDFIFTPQANIDAIWPITQLNTLKLDLGIGHNFYLDHSENDTNSILISPGSQLAFDIFVGDFRINIHDRFSLQQDPIAEIGLSNVSDYGRFENYAGVNVLWDLNKAIATLGYDHYNYISTTSQFEYLDRNAEEVSGTFLINVSSTTGVGVEGNFVDTYYDQNVLNDSLSYSGGLFVETQITKNVKFRIAGGYQGINFDNTGSVADSSDLRDYYVNGLLTHRINGSISQSLSAGHETMLGVNSNFTTLNYIRHTSNWNVITHTLISTEFFYEDADDSGGFFSEHMHRIGGAFVLGYQLTPHVTIGARYQYTQKDSDQPLRDYEQNRISLDGTYSF
jgi:Putative beta-barrel porin 2